MKLFAISVFIYIFLFVFSSYTNGQTYSIDITQKKSGTTSKTSIDQISKAIISKGSGQTFTLEIKPKKSGSSTKILIDDISKIAFNLFTLASPTIISISFSNVTTTSALLGADIISDGNSSITERGIVISTNANPTTTSNISKKSATGTTGPFTISVTGLSANTQYHFRGYAVNSIGTSYTRDTVFSTLVSSLAIPILVTPENNSYGIGSSAVFKWNTIAGISSYDLQIAYDSNFTNMVSNNTGIKTVTKSIVSLPFNTILFWRTRGVKNGETGNWSSVWNFRTASSELIKPVIIYPLENSKNVSVNPILIWNNSASASGYVAIISDKSDFSTTLFSYTGTDSFWNISELLNSKTYYWKLLAKKDNITSEWTSVYKFSTHAAGVGIQNPDEIPKNYYLSQNYPNPFNPSTKIIYTIRDYSFVSLRVFDVFGRELAVLVDKNQNPGIYNITWDPLSIRTGLSSGVYFYMLKAGNFCDTKKMMYIR